MSITDEEIISELSEIHNFYQMWFRGELQENEFKRLEQSLTPNFIQITDDGRILNRKEVLEINKQAYNIGPWEISFSEPKINNQGEFAIITYYEMLKLGEKSLKKIASSVLRKDSSLPNNCIWEHLQETSLPRKEQK